MFMKIEVAPQLNPEEILRRAGYFKLVTKKHDQISWVRRLGSGFYPRFHVYLAGRIINLHLDQKQVSYQGTAAHSGEYAGSVVEAEALRIVEVANQIMKEKFVDI